jgi:parvulin-like peptidyl-prolyl isomerase
MITRLAALLAVAGIALAAGCGGGGGGDAAKTTAQDVPENAVAVVSGTPILKASFDRFFAQAETAFKAQGSDFPAVGTPEYEQLKQEAVDLLVQRAIFEKEAKARGITVTDQEITDRLEQLKKQFYEGNDKQYQDELKQFGLTEDDIRNDLRTKILYEKLFAEVTKDVTVSDADVRKYYDEHKDQYTSSASREVAHILVDTKNEADDLYAQLQAGADFGKLAKKYSKDTASAKDGGKLTARKDGTLVPEFEQAAFELATGEISEPVKTQYGWHVIKALTDITPESTTPFVQVQKDVRDQLLQQKQNDVMTAWVADIRSKYALETAYATGFEPVGAAATTATTTTP